MITVSDEIHTEMEMYLKMYVLLYADDTVILAESSNELQSALDSLNKYCQKWQLKINVSKTKIIIFSKGKVRVYPKFYIGSKEIEVSEDYVYLGVTFAYNGIFNRAIDKQINKARRAMFALLDKAKTLHLPLDIVLELFDRCVTPILLYGCEIWGWTNTKPIEIFHRNFLRSILKTYSFTANCMLYGETGCTDMETKIKGRMINFWAKLKSGNQNKLSSTLCKLAVRLQEKYPDKFDFKWVSYVKRTMETAGFSFVWLNSTVDPISFKQVFQQRLTDMFKQNWHAEMMRNSQCTFYSRIKHNHHFERYLATQDGYIRYAITKFKTRTHHLPITNNRFNDESSTLRLCPLCQDQTAGDEAHYLLRCPFFDKQRDKLLPNGFSKSSNDMLNGIFNSNKDDDAVNLAKFAKEVMSHFKYLNKSKNGNAVDKKNQNN